MRVVTIAALPLLVAAPAFAQATRTLDAVANALGGRDRIAAVRTLVLEGKGDNFNLGQGLTPGAELPRFEVTQYTRRYAFQTRRWELDQTREPRFLTGNTAPVRQQFGVDDKVAYNIGGDGMRQALGGQVAVDRVNELMHHPVGFLQAAWAAGTVVTEEPAGNRRVVRIDVGGNKFAMVVDPATNLPLKTQKLTYNANLGDVLLETEFADWRDVDGLKLPMRITQRLAERWVLSDLRISATRANADVGGLDGMSQFQMLAAAAPAAPVVNVEQIAPGVWYLNGQTHHTVAIEQQRSIVLVEAPQSDERTLAVIEKARGLVPGKPVDVVINTHHHFDHSGGIRAAISQGLTVLTHEGNRDFYERTIFPGKHSITPDAQAKNPKPLRLLPLGDKYVRRDSMRTIETYQVTGSQHSGTMLLVYLPAERLLIQADLYNPPAANATTPISFPFAANLLDNIQRRGLAVERVVGIHGRVVPLSEVQAAARNP